MALGGKRKGKREKEHEPIEYRAVLGVSPLSHSYPLFPEKLTLSLERYGDTIRSIMLVCMNSSERQMKNEGEKNKRNVTDQ